MIDIRSVTHVGAEDLRRLIRGYDSDAKYAIMRSEKAGDLHFTLARVSLAQPYHKRFDHLDADTVARYQRVAELGFSFGAFDGDSCVGIALSEPSHWNRTMWVRELHTAASHQRRGIGRNLVHAVCAEARAAQFRCVVCETQNTNAPAIEFYRRVGFRLEGFDLSYYRNEDFPNGEIALFMKIMIEA